MDDFDQPASRYMRAPVRSVGADESLQELPALLERHRISSLAVVEGDELVGVITRSDLLRVGHAGSGADARRVVGLPDEPASTAMTSPAVTVEASDPLREAARRMVEARIHRIFVTEGDRLVGVISPHEILRAIVDARLPGPISEYMTQPVIHVSPTDSVEVATRGLSKARVTGLVVVENDWPVGVFTQREALAARERPPETPIDGLFSAEIACMPTTTPLHRAAVQSMATRVQRILAMDRRRVAGIMSGIDFARAVS